MRRVLWIAGLGFAGAFLASRAFGSIGRFNLHRYPPYARETRSLFRTAAIAAGLPPSWGDEPGLHEILNRESQGGWVGIPNYTYDRVFGVDISDPANRSLWPTVWEQLREGRVEAGSTATGLGQLKLSNVEKYYPGGPDGIGDPLSEAVGMLRYISDEFNDPAQAWASYQLPPCCGSRLHQNRIERGRGDDCVEGPFERHVNWLDAGCKTHEGY